MYSQSTFNLLHRQNLQVQIYFTSTNIKNIDIAKEMIDPWLTCSDKGASFPYEHMDVRGRVTQDAKTEAGIQVFELKGSDPLLSH